MNAIEIEQAISELAAQPFDRTNFPFAFLAAFGNTAPTIKRLQSDKAISNTNMTDIAGAVLQRNHIHMQCCAAGAVAATLDALRASPATKKKKAKYILATDGARIEAEDLTAGGDLEDTLACDYDQLPEKFGFFLGLAGISVGRELRNSSFDIRATRRLNQLYEQLVKDNPEWGTLARQQDMNHFMARLIFCFFADHTEIFRPKRLFTEQVQKMSDASNTHIIIGDIFLALNTPTQPPTVREDAGVRPWARVFPYVNGELFAGAPEVPHFSRDSQFHLRKISELNWQKINPDIFGSMIQAVADPEQRGQFGIHYTSIPNILRVLNPLFLDGLRGQLDAAGDSPQKLRNLRKRLAHIRILDPACGSGNFLVIAYKQLRKIEADINKRLHDGERRSDLALHNFRGIELNGFAVEIARLALIIAEYQSDVLYRGQQEAVAGFLPLNRMNWVTRGNALQLDWQDLCPAEGQEVTIQRTEKDLYDTPLDQPEVIFGNQGGEVYICGNPPYRGSTWQTPEQKRDLKTVFSDKVKNYRSLDYIAGWFIKAADYAANNPTIPVASAFVSTNSICQGQIVPALWPAIFKRGQTINFAYTSFQWVNLASDKAGVTVVIVGLSNRPAKIRRLYTSDNNDNAVVREVNNINAYLTAAANVIITKIATSNNGLPPMNLGNMPVDGGNLLLEGSRAVEQLNLTEQQRAKFIRPILGSEEFINGISRFCLWIEDQDLPEAQAIPSIATRIEGVRQMRLASRDASAHKMAERPHQFREMYHSQTPHHHHLRRQFGTSPLFTGWLATRPHCHIQQRFRSL